MSDLQAFAMVFEGPQQAFVPQYFQLPDLGEGEVLVEVEYATICTSDLHTFYGRRKSPCHSILGHEITGIILELGEGDIYDYHAEKLGPGDRITWSVYAHDPNDKMSLKGYPQKSEMLYKYGHEPITMYHQLNGGFASHCHLKKNSTLFKLPENLTPQEAAPLNCTHATIAAALRTAGDVEGKNVLVSGVGMLGISACAMAGEKGAAQIIAMDIDADRVQNAQKFGATQWCDAHASVSDLREVLTKNVVLDLDLVIETSGAPDAIEKCLALLSVGGTLVLVGSVFPQRDIAINAEVIVRKILSIKGIHNYTPEDLAEAIRFMQAAKHKYPFESLIGREYALSALDLAFQDADQSHMYRIGIRNNG